ncbi:hypothetical protein GCM10010252_54580 [Streptomyces aureoverticillatus]|nr:hypothetical protein GCM10010252_54580 [Streptomyces aureoverticillatus]
MSHTRQGRSLMARLRDGTVPARRSGVVRSGADDAEDESGDEGGDKYGTGAHGFAASLGGAG